jgi:hypothetical protein
MRLIPGNINDYYDLMISQYGFSEEGNFFLRNNEKQYLNYVSIKEGTNYKIVEKNNHPLSFLTKNYSSQLTKCNSYWAYRHDVIKILFCGKLYKAIRLTGVLTGYPDKVNIFYNYEDLKKYCDKEQIVIPLSKDNQSRHNKTILFWSIESLSNFFDVEDYSDICINNKIVIATFDSHSCDRFNRSKGY